jgi:hypothetical protein
LSIALSSAAHGAEDKQAPADREYSAAAGTGFHQFNVIGNRGTVGEYDDLRSGADAYFTLQGREGRNYLDAYGRFLSANDQTYIFNVDVQRIFQTAFSYQKFTHNLDHDPLTNQDFATDFNPDQRNRILIEELKSGNTLRLPVLPFLQFKMDYRSYSKRGNCQATTVAKCSQCHVSSRNKRVNSTTEDLTFTIAGTAGPATIQYSHLQRIFNEGASPPYNNYRDGASFFLVKGYAPYSLVPDTSNSVHEIKLLSRLPLSSSLFASYQTGEKDNRDTNHDIDYSNIAVRLSSLFFRYCTADTFYNQYHMHNSTPGSIDRNTRRGGFDVSSSFLKKLNLKFSYIWEDIDRDDFQVNSTKSQTYRLTANYRMLRKIRLHFKYQKTRTSDPFVTQDQDFLRLVQTSLPQSAEEFYSSLSWSVLQNFSLNANFRYVNNDNDRYNADEDRYESTLSFWYVPEEKVTVSAAYTYRKTSLDTPVSYKRYHLNDASSLFLFNEAPYDDSSQAYFLSLSYLLNRRTSLTGELTYTRSRAEFDSPVDGTNIGGFSDLRINKLETALGINYLYSRTITLNAKYLFREYNDKNNRSLDGQFSGVSLGLNWSFN